MACGTGRLGLLRSLINKARNSHSSASISQSDVRTSESDHAKFGECQRILLRYCTPALRAFRSFNRFLLNLIYSLAHRLRNHTYRTNLVDCVREKLGYTRVFRLGILILSLQTGFLYAAYSGQLQLLPPFTGRMQARAENTSVFNFLASHSGAELTHPFVELNAPLDSPSNIASHFSTLVSGADLFWNVSEHSHKVQQREGEQKDGEWKLRANRLEKNKEQQRRVLQEHHSSGDQLIERLRLEEGSYDRHAEQRGRYHSNVQDHSLGAPASSTKPTALTRDTDSCTPEFPQVLAAKDFRLACVVHSRLAPTVVSDTISEDEGHSPGGHAGIEVEGAKKPFHFSIDCIFVYLRSGFFVLAAAGRAAKAVFYQWNAATSLWCLLLLFNFVPAQNKWPLRTEKEASAELRRKVHSNRCSYSLRGNSLITCVRTEDNKREETLLKAQQQMSPAQHLTPHGNIQSLPPNQQQQHRTQRWWGRCKEREPYLLSGFVIERGESLELFLQSMELYVVGFFISFFLAKSVFGCECILQQLEAHFAVLLLVSHLQEYMFYFWYHPEKLSVDRFVFNNTFLYALVVGLSVAELLSKPHEFAVGTRLAHVVNHAAPLSYMKQIQQQSESAFLFVQTHRQLLSKQKYLLQSIPVNMLWLELSWLAHLVHATIGSATRHQRSNLSRTQRSGNDGGDSNSGNRVCGSGADAFPLTVGSCRTEPVCTSSLFFASSDTEGTGGSQAAAAPARATVSETSRCYRSCSAACDHWHDMLYQQGKEEEEAVFSNQGEGGSKIGVARGNHAGKKNLAFSNATPSSSHSERDIEDDSNNVARTSVLGDSQALDMLSDRGNGGGDLVEKRRKYTWCWELTFLLCSWTLGALLSIGGLVLRGLAHYTARRNFTHNIACTKTREHALITRGVYAFMRHPGYAGTFYWAVGLQLMVSNVSVLLLTLLVLHVFFSHRIAFEERMLEQLFCDGVYAAYRAATPAIGPAPAGVDIDRLQERTRSPCKAEDRGSRVAAHVPKKWTAAQVMFFSNSFFPLNPVPVNSQQDLSTWTSVQTPSSSGQQYVCANTNSDFLYHNKHSGTLQLSRDRVQAGMIEDYSTATCLMTRLIVSRFSVYMCAQPSKSVHSAIFCKSAVFRRAVGKPATPDIVPH